MALQIKRNELRWALCSGPTRHWGSTLGRAQHIIDEGTLCVMGNTMLVDENAWRNAIKELHTLPYGGRHVWKAREQLWRGIEEATK